MATKRVSFSYAPQDKQKLLHGTKARQILYGGAAGGGKSHSLRWDGIIFCLQNAGLQAYLFRRTLGELQDNHIREICMEIPESIGKYNGAERCVYFENGSILRFCYCEKENDVMRYMGAEMHWIGIDEATHLTPSQIAFLRTRNRLGRYAINPEFKDKEYLPRFVLASNPGGPAHSFLKQVFMDPENGCIKRPMHVFYDQSTVDDTDPEDKGWSSIFIPARMKDNLYLDKGYAGVFSGLPAERAKALRDGDWDAVVGAALDMLSKSRHMVEHFMIPPHWTRFQALDWGTASPFSVGWYAVVGDDTYISHNRHVDATETNPNQSIFLPRGALVRYREWYGWNGKPNKGLRLDAGTVGRKIVEIEDLHNDRNLDYRVADSQMWAQSDGPTPAENMEEGTEGRVTIRQSIKDRKANYNEFIARLTGKPVEMPDGTRETHPMLFITVNCVHFWRTVPTLMADESDPDKGPDVSQEDHVYDEVCYALRSRPFVMTEEDRFEESHGYEWRRLLNRRTADRYATG